MEHNTVSSSPGCTLRTPGFPGHQLWSVLLDLDLITKVEAGPLPIDDPILALLVADAWAHATVERSDAEPDLVLDVRELVSVYAGQNWVF